VKPPRNIAATRCTHPRVILDATPCIELVGADADVIDADDLGHLLEAVDVSVERSARYRPSHRATIPERDRWFESRFLQR